MRWPPAMTDQHNLSVMNGRSCSAGYMVSEEVRCWRLDKDEGKSGDLTGCGLATTNYKSHKQMLHECPQYGDLQPLATWLITEPFWLPCLLNTKQRSATTQCLAFTTCLAMTARPHPKYAWMCLVGAMVRQNDTSATAVVNKRLSGLWETRLLDFGLRVVRCRVSAGNAPT